MQRALELRCAYSVLEDYLRFELYFHFDSPSAATWKSDGRSSGRSSLPLSWIRI